MMTLDERARMEVDEDPPSRAELLAARLTPWSDAELDAAKEPHPHVFKAGERGLFPVGEVTVIGARGREGKTTVMLAVATALCIERSLVGLWPMTGRSVVIYSAEDDRKQYARKVAAQRAVLPHGQGSQVMDRLIVPDLDAPGMEPLKRLVTVMDRQPMPTGTDTAIVEAIAPLMHGPHPPALLIFETLACLTDTEEDNRAFSVLTECLKRIARALQVAVAIVHHVSQASDSTLPDLSITPAALRGGTSLPSNTRQIFMLVNLGSETDPFPANDARTVLRQMVAPDHRERITVLVAMDTSKGEDPPPIFFRWLRTDYGPAAVELGPLVQIEGKSWRKVREMTLAERGSRRDEARTNAREAGVDTVIRVVKELHASGKQPTANAVSLAVGRSPAWATPYLGQAAIDGLLVTAMEDVPRTKGKKMVYRPAADYSDASE